jgi:hypothetical protein
MQEGSSVSHAGWLEGQYIMRTRWRERLRGRGLQTLSVNLRGGRCVRISLPRFIRLLSDDFFEFFGLQDG